MRLGLAVSLIAALAAFANVARAQPLSWPAATEAPAAIAAQFPQSATIQRRLLTAAHASGDSAGVRAALVRLAALGYAPSEQTLALLATHVPVEEMAALRLRFSANAARVQSSRLLTRVPPEQRLVEGVAWEAGTRRLFATSVVGRALLVRDRQGWRPVAGLNAGSLFGLALDPRRGGLWRLLWLASGRVEQTPLPDSAFRGLIAVDVETLREVRRTPAPDGGAPSDLVIGPYGTLYASDPVSGALYMAAAGGTSMSVLVPRGRLVNPQGLALTPDGLRLYVSDYGRGLALVHPFDGTVTRLASDVDTMLDGIDGLVWFRGGLIAIQNGTSPRRILFLRLSGDGRRIVRVRILESNHPEWGEPTLGFVRGREFIYVADAQWERYGPGGTPVGEGPPRPTAIRVMRPDI